MSGGGGRERKKEDVKAKLEIFETKGKKGSKVAGGKRRGRAFQKFLLPVQRFGFMDINF